MTTVIMHVTIILYVGPLATCETCLNSWATMLGYRHSYIAIYIILIYSKLDTVPHVSITTHLSLLLSKFIRHGRKSHA